MEKKHPLASFCFELESEKQKGPQGLLDPNRAGDNETISGKKRKSIAEKAGMETERMGTTRFHFNSPSFISLLPILHLALTLGRHSVDSQPTYG